MEKRLGISVYPGYGDSLENVIAYLERAHALGFSDVFSSVHIPEADFAKAALELKVVAQKARQLGMRLTGDFSPLTFAKYGGSVNDLRPLAELGLSAIRPDFGFGIDDLAELMRNRAGLGVVLNATEADWATLDALKARGVNLTGVEANHNFWNHAGQGASLEFFMAQSRMFKAEGMRVSAFVASQRSKRGPHFEGLPSLEHLRYLPPFRAAEELFLTAVVDAVIAGDPLLPPEELEPLAAVAKRDHLEIRFAPLPNLLEREEEILNRVHTLDRRVSGHLIYARAGWVVSPSPAEAVAPNHRDLRRTPGSVVIDNVNYPRYNGWLFFCLLDMPPHPGSNVVGKVLDKDWPLVQMMPAGARFRLVRSGS